MGLLGGRALFLGPSDIQLGVNESMKDTAKVRLACDVDVDVDVTSVCRFALAFWFCAIY